jgi:hypothetical protein
MTPQDIADRYIAAWNATDTEDRRDLIAATWTEDGRYLDPLTRGYGHTGIDAMIAGVQKKYPGFRFSLTGPVDAHSDVLRFGWALGPEGAPPVARGVDFGVQAADGRLVSITGFLET